MRYLLAIIFSAFSFKISFSQGIVSSNANFKSEILGVLNAIYNNDFTKADADISRIKSKYPQLPVHNILKAVRLNWTMLPLKTDDSLSPIIFKELDEVVKKCNLYLKTDADEDILFCKFTAHSLYAMLLANRKEYLNCSEHARQAYGILKSGFKMAENNPDFLLTSGLYNFYIEQYPKAYPLFKPFTLFFASGNTQEGIKQLEQASEKGLFAKTEAKLYLSYMHLKYLNNPKDAYKWSEKLVMQYPNNKFFLSSYVESAMLLNKYDIAIIHIQELINSKDKNYQNLGNLYNAIYLEKGKFSYSIAKKNYLSLIATYQKNKNTPAHHKSLAYLGLARICKIENNEKLAKEYINKADKYADYLYVKEEIKQFVTKLDE